MQKKILFLLALLCVAVQGAWADTWDGSTTTKPGFSSGCVQINTAAELAYARDHWDDPSGYDGDKDFYELNYSLNTNLDMSVVNWTPMGSAAYSGTFYGNNHSIRIKINDSSLSDNNQGLFAEIRSSGRVQNLKVSGKIKVGNARKVGGICGENDGTIVGCWVSADIESSHYNGATDADLGGIAGLNESGTIEYCIMTGNVTNTGGNSGVGGIAGSNEEIVRHCTFYGTVTCSHSQDNIYVGDQDDTMEDMYHLYYEVHHTASSGHDLYAYAYKYPYQISFSEKNAIQASAAGETGVTGTRYGETVTLTKQISAPVTTFRIKDANDNNVAYSGNINTGSVTFTMPRSDVSIITASEKWTDAGNYSESFTHTDGNTIYIDSEADLALIAHKVNSGETDFFYTTFILTRDLDLSGKGWTPIGTADHPFKGDFDGNQHTISHLEVYSAGDYNGLFGYVKGTIDRPEGTEWGSRYIDNIILSYADVNGGNYTGALAGHVYGCTIIENILVTESDVKGSSYTGGVIGYAHGEYEQLGTAQYESYINLKNCFFFNGTAVGSQNRHPVFGSVARTNEFSYNFFADVANAQEDTYNVRAYPVVVDVPANINCTITDTEGRSYNGAFFAKAQTAHFTVAYKYDSANITSVKLNGNEVGTGTGTYDFTISSTTDSYLITVEVESLVPLMGQGTKTSPYIIADDKDWDQFARIINSGYAYIGEYVRLDANINASMIAGVHADAVANCRPFSGTFLGNNKTITAAITDNNNQGTSLFRYISGATIKNLTVAGTIASDEQYTSALVGFADGNNTIDGCTVTATLNIKSHYGSGFLGHGKTSHTTISNCVFAGTVNGINIGWGNAYTRPHNFGVFWGWSIEGTPELVNCIENGSYNNFGGIHPMGLQGSTGTITNCYYINPQSGVPQNPCTVSGAYQATLTAPDSEIYKAITVNGTTVYSQSCTFTGVQDAYTMDSDPVSLNLTAKYVDDTALTLGTDYTATLNGEAVAAFPHSISTKGNYTLVLTGAGAYSGSKTYQFTVIGTGDDTPITSASTTLTAGEYKVYSDITITSRITINGNVKLHLGEGATLFAKKGIELSSDNSAHLTVEGPGTLTIDDCDNNKSGIGAYNVGTLVINGGTINVTGGSQAAGIGGDRNNINGGTITINGGVINATGGEKAAGIGGGYDNWDGNYGVCGNIVFNGGQVTATGGMNAPGIGPGYEHVSDNTYNSGSLTLNWTALTDFVDCSSYTNSRGSTISSITFAEGKSFVLDGTETVATADNIGGKKIVPNYHDGNYELTDGGSYTATAPFSATSATYKKTTDRVGKFHAWFVPFDYTITDEDLLKFDFYKINMIANAPNAQTNATDQIWVFLKQMSAKDVLHANMPYVYKPKEAVENYPFTTTNAVLKAKATSVVATMQTMEDTYTLYGTYENTIPTASDPFYYVNINGSVSLGNNGTVTVGAFRWIMRVESKYGSTPSYVREIHFFDGEDEATSISEELRVKSEESAEWYDLSGRRLNAQPTKSGLYIYNGRKVLVK